MKLALAGLCLMLGLCGPSPAVAVRPEPVTPDVLHHWNSETDGALRRFTADGVTITLQKRKDGKDFLPFLSVSGPGGATAWLKGEAAWDDRAEADFGIGRIDSVHRSGDVLFSSFSGGAHCCLHAWVLTLIDGSWHYVDLGLVDDGIPPAITFPSDPARRNDGLPVFVMGDQRFLGALDGYVASLMPPQIFAVRHGALIDLSLSPRYHRLFEESAKESLAQCLEHSNGACAAFVAASARLGKFDSAWKIMLANYNRQDNWQNHVCDQRHCPWTTLPYPQALRKFFGQTGYIAASDATR